LLAVRRVGDTERVDRKPSSASGDGEVALVGAGGVASYLARERQKQELRRERDGIVLALAKDLGEQGMAERLGVSRRVVEKLLADARARREREGPADAEPEIVVRRLGVDRERWAQADDHYEALGSAPELRDRRTPFPRSSRPR
jgi:homoserine dehydrogenase